MSVLLYDNSMCGRDGKQAEREKWRTHLVCGGQRRKSRGESRRRREDKRERRDKSEVRLEMGYTSKRGDMVLILCVRRIILNLRTDTHL